MRGLKFSVAILSALIATSLVTAMPTSNSNGNYLGVCEVHNRLLEYDINGVPWSINVPECVVSTAYVIRSTITTNPQEVAQFVEENRSCCCEITKFTRRQIRIGHMLHKYNEIETCTCKPCDEILNPPSNVANVVEDGQPAVAAVDEGADVAVAVAAVNIDDAGMQQDQPHPEVQEVTAGIRQTNEAMLIAASQQ